MINKKERGLKKMRKTISLFEIVLLVSFSFAVAFFMNESFVSASATGAVAATTKGIKTLNIPSGSAINPGTYTSGAITGPNGGFLTATTANPAQAIIQNGQMVITQGGETVMAGSPSAFTASGGAVTGTTSTYQLPLGIDTGLASSGIPAHLLKGVVWGAVAYGVIRMVAPMLGLDKKNSNTLAIAVAAGAFTYQGLLGLQTSGTISGGGFLSSGAFPVLGGVAVAAAIFILLYKKEKKELVSFQCLPYEPPTGGSKCEECNKDPFRPCSEYRCKSLGQACQILNPGSGQERCAWVNPRDVNSPTIAPWNAALKPEGFIYITDTSIRPPALGVKIVTTGQNECLPAFTPLEFGITTNEPAQCKLDYTHTTKFDQMQFYFGENNYYAYNHTQRMRLPGPETGNLSGSPLIKNDGTFSLYVRCRDANGNENVDEYAVSYCVDQGPDTTPPIIESTSINSGSYVQFNAEKVPVELFVNEPSECRWSKQNKDYGDMENQMICDTESYQINSDLVFTCRSELNTLKNNEDNSFFFRCKDQPGKPENERNVNSQSYPLVLKGSKAILNVLDVRPGGNLSGPTTTIDIKLEAETANGVEDGKAICYFSDSPVISSYVQMFETMSFEHKQDLTLGAGTYTYYIRCIDSGGNAAEGSTTFTVFIDKTAPKVTRVYKEGGDALKLVTNEDAECSYSLNNCNFNFDEGVKFLHGVQSEKRVMFAEWKPNSVYHIKCRDEFDNEPDANTCSMIAAAVQISSS